MNNLMSRRKKWHNLKNAAKRELPSKEELIQELEKIEAEMEEFGLGNAE